MAIFRRDRSFSKIFDEVDVETIPVHFIKQVRFIMDDNTEIIIDHEEMQKVDSIEQLVLGGSLNGTIVDMQIQLDYDSIEQDVTSNVSKLLNNDKKDD